METHSAADKATINNKGDWQAINFNGSADQLFAIFRQQLYNLSTQADIKANVIVSVSAVIISLIVGNAYQEKIRITLTLVMVPFLALALIFALFAIIPTNKKPFKSSTKMAASELNYDPLFFGILNTVPIEKYLADMALVLSSPEQIYKHLTINVYNQSVYLVEQKYRYLRIAYCFFTAGFLMVLVVTAYKIFF